MPPFIAALIFTLVILGLFWLDKDRQARTSWALWVPVIWLSLCCSRMVSQWLSFFGFSGFGSGIVDTPDQYLDGSPVDRFFLTGLLVLGIVVLARRGPKVVTVLQANWPILLFVAYCGLSSVWSDYPDIAFKRWIKSLSDVVMAMIVLTDPNPGAAFKRFLARVGFVLMPLSILFIKYYPDIGRGYDRWTGAPIYTGVTYSKNILGMVCLVLGLGALWRLSKLLPGKQRWFRNKPLLAQATLLAMAIWLLSQAGSATALSCFLLGGTLLLLARRRTVARRPGIVHGLVAVFLTVPAVALFLDLGSGMLQTLGRDPTLTGRTDVWKHVLGMTDNPLFGSGFESFWLGKRLEALWQIYWFKPTEAHNGYIEVFLNLGWIGLLLLAFVVGVGYRRIVGDLHRGDNEATLKLAFLFIALAYNFTEAAFKMMHPVWIVLLLSVLAVPRLRLSKSGEDSRRDGKRLALQSDEDEAPAAAVEGPKEEPAVAGHRQPSQPWRCFDSGPLPAPAAGENGMPAIQHQVGFGPTDRYACRH